MVELVSIIAVAIIAASIYVAWSGRFLATGALVLGNVMVFGLTMFGSQNRYLTSAGPRYVPVIHEDLALHSDLLLDGAPVAFMQLFTSMFVHADFYHILGNVIVLLAFAMPFEEKVGHRKFVVIYLVSGIAAALAQMAWNWGEPMRLMGASGAMFGIIGAFASTFPRQVIVVPVPVIIIFFAKLRVFTAALIFLGLQLLYFAFLSPFDNTAYWAHFGGLAAGALIAPAIVRKQAPSHIAVNGLLLTEFAKDTGSRQALDYMSKSEDEPQVWQAWLERFFKTAQCPTCGNGVYPKPGGKIHCQEGHEFDVRIGKTHAK